MANATTKLANCPTCGVKLHRTDLSLCAYCASPLNMGASSAPPDDETQRMFAKIQAHATYADSMNWTPMDPRADAKARKLQMWGNLVVAATVASIVYAALFGSGPFLARGPVLGSVVLIAIAIFLIAGAITVRGNALNEPMLRRPARVLDRSSTTAASGKIGATLYAFQLRFADGSEGEFAMAGRGTMYEPPTVGASGIAYTRGADMIEFKRF